MFRKINNASGGSGFKKEIPSVVAHDFNVLGNIISDGVVDFDGRLDGNISCTSLVVRKNGVVNGEITADSVQVHGRVKGIIRARHVALSAGSSVEGIVMHQTLTIADGAVIDGKLKRTDRALAEMQYDEIEENYPSATPAPRLLQGLRIIESGE